jgi:hypothetical protein
VTLQGDFLVLGKWLPIQAVELIVFETNVNQHSTYWSWSWRCKNYFAIVTDFFIQLLEFEELPSLLNYIQEWKLSFWVTCFFKEFRSKDGIRRSKLWEQQIDGVMTLALGLWPRQGLTTKVKAWKGVGKKCNPRVTFTLPRL